MATSLQAAAPFAGSMVEVTALPLVEAPDSGVACLCAESGQIDRCSCGAADGACVPRATAVNAPGEAVAMVEMAAAG